MMRNILKGKVTDGYEHKHTNTQPPLPPKVTDGYEHKHTNTQPPLPPKVTDGYEHKHTIHSPLSLQVWNITRLMPSCTCLELMCEMHEKCLPC